MQMTLVYYQDQIVLLDTATGGVLCMSSLEWGGGVSSRESSEIHQTRMEIPV